MARWIYVWLMQNNMHPTTFVCDLYLHQSDKNFEISNIGYLLDREIVRWMIAFSQTFNTHWKANETFTASFWFILLVRSWMDKVIEYCFNILNLDIARWSQITISIQARPCSVKWAGMHLKMMIWLYTKCHHIWLFFLSSFNKISLKFGLLRALSPFCDRSANTRHQLIELIDLNVSRSLCIWHLIRDDGCIGRHTPKIFL